MSSHTNQSAESVDAYDLVKFISVKNKYHAERVGSRGSVTMATGGRMRTRVSIG